jgi:DnaJ-class molecular chaperone
LKTPNFKEISINTKDKIITPNYQEVIHKEGVCNGNLIIEYEIIFPKKLSEKKIQDLDIVLNNNIHEMKKLEQKNYSFSEYIKNLFLFPFKKINDYIFQNKENFPYLKSNL